MKTGERLGPVETQLTVTRGIDKNRHLNNVWWGLLLERGRAEVISKYGIEMGMPLRRLCINYDAQIFQGDRITVVTFASLQNDSVVFSQKIAREDAEVGSSLSMYCKNALLSGDSMPATDSEMSAQLRKRFPLRGLELHHLTAPYYYEKGRERFLNERGVEMKKLREDRGIRFVVSILDMQFFNPMHKDQHVQVKTALDVDDYLFSFGQQMNDGNQVLNSAQVICAVISRDDHLIDDQKVIRPIVRLLLKSPSTL